MASLNSPRTTADMEEILKTAAERAIRYVQMARERKVAPAEKDLAALTTFHEPFPAEGSNPADVVAMLDEFGSPATVATTGCDRERIEKVAAEKQCDVASLLRRGLDIVTDPAWASVKFEPEVYNALLEEANKKLWDLSTLTRAAVMAQYLKIFSKEEK